MLELFGFAWVTITFTCCVAAVSTRRSVLRWMKARTDRKRLDDTVEIVRRPMRKVATYAALVALAVPAGVLAGGTALPGPSGGFGGGTVGSAVVLTGDNSGGTGTLRIRPGDEDTAITLCEASNNAATEVCSTFTHYNASATVAGTFLTSNGYTDSAGALQRFNTAFGVGQFNTSSSSTAASNFAGMNVYGTGGAVAGNAALVVTGANTSTFYVGTNGTVTTDIRGPILNGGSATCNGGFAGSLCFNDEATLFGANGAFNLQMTATTGLVYAAWVNSSGTIIGSNGYGGSTFSDADLADRVFVTGVGKVLMMGRSDDVAAGSVHSLWVDNYVASGVTLMDVLGNGMVRPLLYGSQTDCTDNAGAAACSAAPTGAVVIDDGATTVVVSTTAVTANSTINVSFDPSLGTKLGITCNTTQVFPYVSARTAATSFTITSADPAGVNKACFSYSIIN